MSAPERQIRLRNLIDEIRELTNSLSLETNRLASELVDCPSFPSVHTVDRIQVMVGDVELLNSACRALVNDLAGFRVPNSRSGALHQPLSRRECQVLRLLAAGATLSQSAARLGISVKSASTYRARILRKCNLKTTGDLIRYAVRRHLSPLDSA